MNYLVEAVKMWVRKFFRIYSVPEPIEDSNDYNRVKAWIKKVIILYSVFTGLSIFFMIIGFSIFSAIDLPGIIYMLLPILVILTAWGYASIILYAKDIFKSVAKAGKAGYKVGEQIETTYVDVTHEYGKTYRVSSHTENKGCLFAMISAGAKFFFWGFFCVYIGPVLTFKKVWYSVKNIKAYEAKNIQG